MKGSLDGKVTRTEGYPAKELVLSEILVKLSERYVLASSTVKAVKSLANLSTRSLAAALARQLEKENGEVVEELVAEPSLLLVPGLVARPGIEMVVELDVAVDYESDPDPPNVTAEVAVVFAVAVTVETIKQLAIPVVMMIS